MFCVYSFMSSCFLYNCRTTLPGTFPCFWPSSWSVKQLEQRMQTDDLVQTSAKESRTQTYEKPVIANNQEKVKWSRVYYHKYHIHLFGTYWWRVGINGAVYSVRAELETPSQNKLCRRIVWWRRWDRLSNDGQSGLSRDPSSVTETSRSRV